MSQKMTKHTTHTKSPIVVANAIYLIITTCAIVATMCRP